MKNNILGLLVLLFAFVAPVNAKAQSTPQIVTTTIAVEGPIRAAINAWLATSAPAPYPNWAITYVGIDKGEAGRFVSLLALDIDSPTQEWSATDDNAVLWMGSVIVYPDYSVEMHHLTEIKQAGNGSTKMARPLMSGPGGGAGINFPWQSGGAMMYGPRGVHDAGEGAYADGMSAVDFVGGDDYGSGVAPARAYAAAAGTVDYVCADSTTTLVRTTNETTGDVFIYAHLLTNANLVEEHEFGKGALIGSLKYGTFTDDCGWAEQADNHYHLHFGFTPASNSFRIENCLLNITTQEWKCGTQTVKTSQFLQGGGSGSTGGENDGIGSSVSQPGFFDYILTGGLSIWDRAVVRVMPSHSAMQFTYVIYNAIKLTIRIAQVMVYSNINLGHLITVVLIGFYIKLLLGIAEFVVFLFKTWKSLVPVLGA